MAHGGVPEVAGVADGEGQSGVAHQFAVGRIVVTREESLVLSGQMAHAAQIIRHFVAPSKIILLPVALRQQVPGDRFPQFWRMNFADKYAARYPVNGQVRTLDGETNR